MIFWRRRVSCTGLSISTDLNRKRLHGGQGAPSRRWRISCGFSGCRKACLKSSETQGCLSAMHGNCCGFPAGGEIENAADKMVQENMTALQAQEYVTKLLAPDKRQTVKVACRDTGFFINTVYRAAETMCQSGVMVKVERETVPEGERITIVIPSVPCTDGGDGEEGNSPE